MFRQFKQALLTWRECQLRFLAAAALASVLALSTSPNPAQAAGPTPEQQVVEYHKQVQTWHAAITQYTQLLWQQALSTHQQLQYARTLLAQAPYVHPDLCQVAGYQFQPFCQLRATVGQLQSQYAAQRFQAFRFGYIVSSPFAWCVGTTTLLAPNGDPCEPYRRYATAWQQMQSPLFQAAVIMTSASELERRMNIPNTVFMVEEYCRNGGAGCLPEIVRRQASSGWQAPVLGNPLPSA